MNGINEISTGTPRIRLSPGVSNAKFLTVLLLCSLSLNVVLGWQIRSLKRAMANAPALQQPNIVGVTLSSLLLKDLDGKPAAIKFTNMAKPSVIYVFHPKCAWCGRNLDNIKTLANERGGAYQFIGLSLNDPGLQTYVQSSGLGFPVYCVASYKDVPDLKLGGTPETVVVSPGGKVLKNWFGAYTGEKQHEIESYFSLKLPGLVDLPRDAESH
jgi:hypothetical protein